MAEDKKAAREAYVRSHNPEDDTLCQLRKMSVGLDGGRMATNPVTGKLLTFLCKSINAKKVIDIGVFTGCSSFAMALVLPEGGKVIACDISTESTDLGRPYWEQGGIAEKVDLRIQPATNTLQELLDKGEGETFDFIFIDADKINYPTYFDLGVKLLRSGGMFLVDNAIWSGRVADPSETDEDTIAIRKINALMRDDPRVDYVLMDLADGLGLARKL